jgi:hypothetical protein
MKTPISVESALVIPYPKFYPVVNRTNVNYQVIHRLLLYVHLAYLTHVMHFHPSLSLKGKRHRRIFGHNVHEFDCILKKASRYDSGDTTVRSRFKLQLLNNTDYADACYLRPPTWPPYLVGHLGAKRPQELERRLKSAVQGKGRKTP